MKQAGQDVGEREQQTVVQRPLFNDREKVQMMMEGGDLRNEIVE